MNPQYSQGLGSSCICFVCWITVWFLYCFKNQNDWAPLGMWWRFLENLRMLGRLRDFGMWQRGVAAQSSEPGVPIDYWEETRPTAKPQKRRQWWPSWGIKRVCCSSHCVSCGVAPESWPTTERRTCLSGMYVIREKAAYKPCFISVIPNIIIWVFSYKSFSLLFHIIIKSSWGMY